MYKGEHTCPEEKKVISESLPDTEEKALEWMMVQLPIVHDAAEAKIFKAALYAAKATIAEPSSRRVFIQDFAASLNRAGLLRNALVDAFCKYGYAYMAIKKS